MACHAGKSGRPDRTDCFYMSFYQADEKMADMFLNLCMKIPRETPAEPPRPSHMKMSSPSRSASMAQEYRGGQPAGETLFPGFAGGLFS